MTMYTGAVLIIADSSGPRSPLPLDALSVARVLHARGLSTVFAAVDASADPLAPEHDPRPVAESRDEHWLRERLTHPLTLATCDEHPYGAVVVCDHGPGLSALVGSEAFGRIVRVCTATRRPLVAIARAPRALAAVTTSDGSPYLRGRRITYAREASECTPGDSAAVERDLRDLSAAIRDAGAEVRFQEIGSEHVVVDAYLLTAQNVRSAATAGRTLAAYAATPPRIRRRAS